MKPETRPLLAAAECCPFFSFSWAVSLPWCPSFRLMAVPRDNESETVLWFVSLETKVCLIFLLSQKTKNVFFSSYFKSNIFCFWRSTGIFWAWGDPLLFFKLSALFALIFWHLFLNGPAFLWTSFFPPVPSVICFGFFLPSFLTKNRQIGCGSLLTFCSVILVTKGGLAKPTSPSLLCDDLISSRVGTGTPFVGKSYFSNNSWSWDRWTTGTPWGNCYWNLPRLPEIFRHTDWYECICLNSLCTRSLTTA